MIADTVVGLEYSLEHTNDQLQNFSHGSFPMPNNEATDLENLQEEIASIKQCLVICSHAASTADQYRTYTFQDTSISNDSSTQIIVATAGDLISAKSITSSSRSIQILGVMGDESMKHLMKAYEEKRDWR